MTLCNHPLKRAALAALGICALLLLCACALTDAALIPPGSSGPTQAPNQTPTRPNDHPTPAPLPALATAASDSAACVVIYTEGKPLNVRTGPGLIWPVRAVLMPGESISLANPTPGAAWYPLASGGYISADFCEVIK